MSLFLALIVWQVGDEHLRKQHRSLAELHYSKAVCLFLSLKDAPCELLRTLLERVAFAEFTMAGEQLFNVTMMSVSFVRGEGLNWRTFCSIASRNVSFCVSTGQSSSVAKLKSLTGALEVMTETRYAFQLIHKELLEEQTEVYLRVGHILPCLFSFANLVTFSWSDTVTFTFFSYHFIFM